MATGGSGHDIMFFDKREARVVKTFSENPEGESRFEVFLEQILLIFNDFFSQITYSVGAGVQMETCSQV